MKEVQPKKADLHPNERKNGTLYVKDADSTFVGTEKEEYDCNGDIDGLDCAAVKMEEYVDMMDAEAADLSLCEDCKMDYGDKEATEFKEGITEAENTGSRGNSKVTIFFPFLALE